jgi:hypothetical protein
MSTDTSSSATTRVSPEPWIFVVDTALTAGHTVRATEGAGTADGESVRVMARTYGTGTVRSMGRAGVCSLGNALPRDPGHPGTSADGRSTSEVPYRAAQCVASATSLHLVHEGICALEDALGSRRGPIPDGDTDTCSDLDWTRRDTERLLECVVHSVGDRLQVRRVGDVVAQHREFVTAETSDSVARA